MITLEYLRQLQLHPFLLCSFPATPHFAASCLGFSRTGAIGKILQIFIHGEGIIKLEVRVARHKLKGLYGSHQHLMQVMHQLQQHFPFYILAVLISSKSTRDLNPDIFSMHGKKEGKKHIAISTLIVLDWETSVPSQFLK